MNFCLHLAYQDIPALAPTPKTETEVDIEDNTNCLKIVVIYVFTKYKSKIWMNNLGW